MESIQRPLIYNVAQASRLFSVEEDTIRKWARNRVIPAKRVGKRWFFVEKDILEFFSNYSHDSIQ